MEQQSTQVRDEFNWKMQHSCTVCLILQESDYYLDLIFTITADVSGRPHCVHLKQAQFMWRLIHNKTCKTAPGSVSLALVERSCGADTIGLGQHHSKDVWGVKAESSETEANPCSLQSQLSPLQLHLCFFLVWYRQCSSVAWINRSANRGGAGYEMNGSSGCSRAGCPWGVDLVCGARCWCFMVAKGWRLKSAPLVWFVSYAAWIPFLTPTEGKIAK